ncbi:unnamed protein product [Fraxinus pennsylvanica]|uniref:Uncharacterized protein n=1 Tax=Fraxinus pennsylvanica TaxID=56036 RepID=A0AAD1YXE7_9LAMI|nr:unnamed protein product [Fraxinus pennsylvanica]
MYNSILLILFFFWDLLIILASAIPTQYSPPDSIAISCGSSGNSTALDGRVVEDNTRMDQWAGASKVAAYRDYIVMMEGDKMMGMRNLTISFRSKLSILNGLEVFKLSNPDNSLAGMGPVHEVQNLTSTTRQRKLLSFGSRNAIATALTIIITLLNIAVYHLRSVSDTNSGPRNIISPSREYECRRCLHTQPHGRPAMADVVMSLELALVLEQNKDTVEQVEEDMNVGRTYSDHSEGAIFMDDISISPPKGDSERATSDEIPGLFPKIRGSDQKNTKTKTRDSSGNLSQRWWDLFGILPKTPSKTKASPLLPEKAECFSITATNAAAAVCNGTRIADCIPDDEEFSMELDISRRNLLVPKVPSKTIPVLKPTKLSCDADVQASCIDRPNQFYDKRPCNYKNLCDRPPIAKRANCLSIIVAAPSSGPRCNATIAKCVAKERPCSGYLMIFEESNVVTKLLRVLYCFRIAKRANPQQRAKVQCENSQVWFQRTTLQLSKSLCSGYLMIVEESNVVTKLLLILYGFRMYEPHSIKQ